MRGGVEQCREEEEDGYGGEAGLYTILPRSMGNTSMITYISYKCPSYPVSCLFECLFYDFLDAFLLIFDYIMTRNEFFPPRDLS